MTIRTLRLTLLVFIFSLSGCSLFAPSYQNEPPSLTWQSFNSELSLQTEWLVFGQPENSELGLVFYPGGKVDPEAYGELANALAEQYGLFVVIVPMPLDLAVLGSKRANAVQTQFSTISQWIIGGHSLGGTMAASLAHKNPDQWQGLVFLASYPQDKHDFSTRPLPVLTVIGDQDGLISIARWQQSLKLLPTDTISVVIDGGNHAGFGTYGTQADDGVATVSQAQQRAETLVAFGTWLEPWL